MYQDFEDDDVLKDLQDAILAVKSMDLTFDEYCELLKKTYLSMSNNN